MFKCDLEKQVGPAGLDGQVEIGILDGVVCTGYLNKDSK